jgi:hypothetical protein
MALEAPEAADAAEAIKEASAERASSECFRRRARRASGSGVQVFVCLVFDVAHVLRECPLMALGIASLIPTVTPR